MDVFQTIFAVPMTCQGCADELTVAISSLAGIRSVDTSLKTQQVVVNGSAAPSAIHAAIQSTGRDAIMRGSGEPNSAAVCILETPFSTATATNDAPATIEPLDSIRGLIRIVQVSPQTTLFDISVRGLRSGNYVASVRASGDLSSGLDSMGPAWKDIGKVTVLENGSGALFVPAKVDVAELVGRGMAVVSQGREGEAVLGVVARSAGAWDNEKTVCSCSGKTVWEERGDMLQKGML